jgi:hypothetical protein
MITFASRSLARNAAARFATELLLTRCRTGAEQALMPQGRWFAANTQGLHDWLKEGGFQSEIEPKQRERVSPSKASASKASVSNVY